MKAAIEWAVEVNRRRAEAVEKLWGTGLHVRAGPIVRLLDIHYFSRGGVPEWNFLAREIGVQR